MNTTNYYFLVEVQEMLNLNKYDLRRILEAGEFQVCINLAGASFTKVQNIYIEIAVNKYDLQTSQGEYDYKRGIIYLYNRDVKKILGKGFCTVFSFPIKNEKHEDESRKNHEDFEQLIDAIDGKGIEIFKGELLLNKVEVDQYISSRSISQNRQSSLSELMPQRKAGRPNYKKFYLEEFKSRIDRNQVEKSKRQQCMALEKWLKNNIEEIKIKLNAEWGGNIINFPSITKATSIEPQIKNLYDEYTEEQKRK